MNSAIRKSDRMKKEKRFLQISEEKQINNFPLPEYIFLKVTEQKGFKIPPVGSRVSKFEEIIPGVVSPVSGEIKEILNIPVDEIGSDVIKIAPVQEEETDTVLPDNLIYESPDIILSQLKKSGYFLEEEISSGCDIIISAADADPLCSVSQQILRDSQSFLKEKFDPPWVQLKLEPVIVPASFSIL